MRLTFTPRTLEYYGTVSSVEHSASSPSSNATSHEMVTNQFFMVGKISFTRFLRREARATVTSSSGAGPIRLESQRGRRLSSHVQGNEHTRTAGDRKNKMYTWTICSNAQGDLGTD